MMDFRHCLEFIVADCNMLALDSDNVYLVLSLPDNISWCLVTTVHTTRELQRRVMIHVYLRSTFNLSDGFYNIDPTLIDLANFLC